MRSVARSETIIGGIAAAVAVIGFGVFGYKAMTADDAPARGARRAIDDGTGGDGGGGAGAGVGISGLDGPLQRRRTEIVDNDYRFRLAAPGPAWDALDREAADATLIGKLAALVSDSARIEVGALRVGAVEIAAATPFVESLLGEPVDRTEPMTWLGRDAIEVRAHDYPGVGASRVRAFVQDGLLYTVTLLRGAQIGWDQLDVDAMWGAFAMLPGRARATTPDFAPTERAGIGWRVRGRTWESAVNGVTVTAPPGWRLVTGPAAGGVLTDVALANDACGCTIWLASTATAPHTDVNPRTISVEMLGQSYLLYTADPDPLGIYQSWNNLIDFDNGLVLRFIANYPKADATTGILELRRALAQFKTMPATDHQALADALGLEAFSQTGVGPAWATRGGVHANFDWGLVWTHPGGYWRVSAGPEVGRVEPGAIFIATEAQLGYSVVAVPDDGLLAPGASPRASMKGLLGKPVKVPALPGGLTDGWEIRWTDDEGLAQVYRVAALRGRAHAFRIQWSGEAEVIARYGDRLDAALAGFAERAGLQAADAQPYVDRRWGYRMDLPASWAIVERGDDSASARTNWQADPSELIGVATFTYHDGVTGEATSWWARAAASAAVGQGTAPAPRRSAGDLAGEQAQVLRWDEGSTLVTLYLVERGDIVFAVYARGTAATAAMALAAFRWVDRPDS
jgi:hypothetical protein